MKFLSIKRSPSVVRTVIRDRYDKVIDDTVVITYGVTNEEATRWGLPCGGTLELVMEPVTEQLERVPLLRAISGSLLIHAEC